MSGLPDVLADWLPGRRWYAGQDRPRDVTVETVATLVDGDPRLDLVIATVTHDRGTDRYQIPLSIHREPADHLDHARVGAADLGDGMVYLYDAPFDHDVNGAWLRLMAAGETVGDLTFAGEIDDPALPGRPMSAEQSNTSIAYGDRYIFKLYRRLTDEPNPDLEVTRRLAEIGATTVPPAVGWVTGAGSTLGLLQPFLRGGTEGWAMALTSVRDLYAEGDLHAEEVGGDFAPESRRLGAVTACLHADLARAFETRLASREEAAATAAMLHDRLAQATESVPALGEHAGAIRRVYDALADLDVPVPVQRIHGDLHLGQVMRTEHGWLVLDFEGEPARPLAERRALMSPLRDVAGMLRSFDYAARHLLADHPEASNLEYRAAEWADRNRDAFCDGYAAQGGTDPRDSAVLLRAFELDKAVYEVAYEASHRPSWLSIPLAGIARITRTIPAE